MRTCGQEYDLQGQNLDIHLTNNCFQQNTDNYGKFEPGNTLPLENLFDYLESLYPTHGPTIKAHIIQRIKDLIIDTVLSSKKNMLQNQSKKYNVFELFGFDFLVDEDLRTWLIECNNNPYLGVPNDFIKKLLPKMLNQLFYLALDPHFPP